MNTHTFRWRSALRVLALLFAAVFSTAHASDDNDWWSMGPVGGKFQVQSGTSFIVVRSVEAGGPAALAGVQAGDYVMGAYGKSFEATPGVNDGYMGAPKGFADAIERAESSDGLMPLTLLRSGVGSVDVTVTLPVAGAFGPAYPLGSAKFDGIYQRAAGKIHDEITNSSSGSAGYMTGFYGIILLADPSWNDTTGAKPYRLSIDKIKDRCVTLLNAAIVNPVEATNVDGTPNDGSVNDSNPSDQSYVAPAHNLENWDLSVSAMFLAEYRQKTGDTSVDTTVQRAADLLAGRIQTWQQPSNGPTKVGLMAHGGVANSDYPHIGYSGINIINAHAMTAMAMLKTAGATIDDTKMQATWEWCKSSTNVGNGWDDGNVGYAWVQGGGDSGGRTAGVAFSMASYGGLSSADEDRLKRMKDYLSRTWMRMQHAHAYTVAGSQFYQFVLPYLPDRDQRYIMENQRMFYHFHRTSSDALTYFGGRANNGGDGYVGTARVAYTDVAMAQAVASGNLTTIASIDNTRIHADFQSPYLTWPALDARHVEIEALSQAFTVDVTDYEGTSLIPADYSATWSHVSGPATSTFTSANTVNTTANFPQDGTYRIQLEVVKGGYTLTEPIDVVVNTVGAAPAGYSFGGNQRIYNGISGSVISDMTGNAKYPNSPDELNLVTSLDIAYSGSDFGQSVSGFIVAPTTGDYTFYVAGDDAVEFNFNSAGTDPAGASTICSVPTWTNQYEWTKHSSQTSSVVSLTAGQYYYYELLHKQGGGGVHTTVAWSGPGIATPTAISGAELLVADSLSIVTQPSPQTTTLGGSAAMTLTVGGDGPFIYEWFLDGVSLGASQVSANLNLTNVSGGAAGDYHCVVTYAGGTLTSATASLTISDAGVLVQGGLWRDQFDGISGNAVSDLTGHSSYPRSPTSAEVIDTAESDREVGNSYGSRWTGWLTPDVTGNYTFYIASDDSSELWLSTDDQPANKVLAASLSYAVLSRNWDAGGKSVAISLVAGQNYYIEVLHKEGSGSDYCGVAWQKPGEGVPVDGADPIPGQHLSYFTGGVHGTSVVLPPVFDSAGYAWNFDETVSAGISVGTVSAADVNTPLTYAITAGNTNGDFSINSSTGEITLVNALDFETIPSYSLTIQATNTVSLIGQVTATITVNDIYDAQFIVDTNFEDSDGFTGYSGHSVLATTTDNLGNQWSTPDDAHIWNNSGIPPLGVQCLALGVDDNPSSAEIVIPGTDHGVGNVTFDYASIAGSTNVTFSLSYRVGGGSWVQAWSTSVVGLSPDWTVKPWTTVSVDVDQTGDVDLKLEISGTKGVLVDTFKVKDNRPNLPPVASDGAMSVFETVDVGTSVGTVVASDPNTGDPLTYAITGGNTGNAFAINAVTGEITLASNLDYDVKSQYLLIVSVTDTLGLSDTATQTITVDPNTIGLVDIFYGNDIYDGASYINGWSEVTAGHVSETLNGTELNRNQDGGSGATWLEGISSSLDGGATTWNTGNDGDWTWEGRIRVNDSPNGFALWLGTGLDIAIVEIYNDRTQGRGVGSFNVAHTNNDGAYHTWRVANDSVAGKYHVWRDGELLTPAGGVDYDSSSDDDRMVIGDTTGGTFGNAHHIDIDYIAYDQTGVYAPPASGNAPPVATDNSASIAENVASGTAVVTVAASDPDVGDSLSYAITAGNTGGAFTIDSNGNITTAAAMDYETVNSYSLTVTVTDTSSATDTATVTVTVTDVTLGDDSGGNTLNDNWEVLHFGTVGTVAPTADTDTDGMTVFEEMVFGGNPSINDSNDLPVSCREVDDAGTPKLEFKFRRPQNHADLGVTYQLQTCNDLQSGSWADDATSPSAPVVEGSNEWITYLIPMPSGAETKVFARCRVTSP